MLAYTRHGAICAMADAIGSSYAQQTTSMESDEMFYLTTENRYGHRALFRCYRTDCGGFISVFVRFILAAHEDTD